MKKALLVLQYHTDILYIRVRPHDLTENVKVIHSFQIWPNEAVWSSDERSRALNWITHYTDPEFVSRLNQMTQYYPHRNHAGNEVLSSSEGTCWAIGFSSSASLHPRQVPLLGPGQLCFQLRSKFRPNCSKLAVSLPWGNGCASDYCIFL